MGRKRQTEIVTEKLYVERPTGKLDDGTKKEVKDLLKKLFNMGILLQKPIPEVCREYFPGFAQDTIVGILKSILPEINDANLIDMQFKFDGLYKSVVTEGLEIAQNGDFEKDTEKMYALSKAAELMDKYITFMERFGIKPKVPDVIETRSGQLSVDKMREIYEANQKRKEE